MTDTAAVHIPESLEIALKEGNVIPFVGAGVSRAIEKRNKTKSFDPLFPSWTEFLHNAADKLDREKIALNDQGKSQKAITIRALLNDPPIDYLGIAQRAFDSLEEYHWNKLLVENFEKDLNFADEDSKKLAKLIWQLGSNLVVTTNVDSILETVCEKPGRVKILDTQKPEFAEIQRDWKPAIPTVLHLHGHVDNKADVIFTKKQYDEFYNKEKNQAKLDTLRSLFTQRTILFIGFSMDDLFILRELERVNLIYEGGVNSYYVLIRNSDKDNANIPTFVQPISFSDFGPPLENLLEKFVQIANPSQEAVNSYPTIEFSGTPAHMEAERLKTHFNIPFSSKGDAFVGREGLPEQIWTSLNKSGRAAIGQAVNIKGIGGLGKTQLAVEYAHLYREKYKNGVFWLTADEDLNVQLIKIGENLGWISQFDKGFDQAELVRKRFRKLSDCLVIFDNVDDQNVIENYLPIGDAHPHILVTSREEQSGFYPINLDILNRDESRKLLTEIAERLPDTDTEKEALDNILKELDGLPLAVELVGGYLLRRKNISFQNYYEYLEKEPLERLEKRFPNESFTRHDKSIIRTLKISEELFNETLYLKEILDILSWSGKASMGTSLLRHLVGTCDDFALKDAIGVALELHFIKQEEEADRYSIHRLLARVRKHESPLDNKKEWQQKILKNLISWFRKKEEEYKTRSEGEIELDHLETWQKQTPENFSAEKLWLLMLRATPLKERANYNEAKKYYEEALTLYERWNIFEPLILSHLYKEISEIHYYLGNYQQSKTYLQNILAFYEKELVKDRELLPYLYNNLGIIHKQTGKFTESLAFHKKALEMQREININPNPQTANYLDNLGSVYTKLHRYTEGLKYHEEALFMRQELFGEDHLHVAISFNNTALSHTYLREFEKAFALFQQTISNLQALFGEKHPEIAQTLNNLGFAYEMKKDTQMALYYYQASLVMSEELLGENHPAIISRLANVVRMLIASGRIEEGGRLAGDSLGITPLNHPERMFLEKHGMGYYKAQQRKKKRRKK